MFPDALVRPRTRRDRDPASRQAPGAPSGGLARARLPAPDLIDKPLFYGLLLTRGQPDL
jgi:hypothetical protein